MGNQPRVHVYAMAHNEEYMIRYFMRHYTTFAERIVIVDNESVDGTARVAKEMGAEVRPFKSGGYSERVLLGWKNSVYHESRGQADWVVVCDVDEFVWHPALKELLARYLEEGVTMPRTRGWNMVTEKPPSGDRQIYDEAKWGIRNILYYSKYAVFHPSININYGAGSHSACPTGRVTESREGEIYFLHYMLLGWDFFREKYLYRWGRAFPEDRVEWGIPRTASDIRACYDAWMRSGELERVVP